MKGFRELKSEVIDCELCTRCGTCIGVCPVQTLSYTEDRVTDTENRCIQCGKCNAVCPGKEFLVDQWSEELFQRSYDVDQLFGTYLGMYCAYSQNIEIRRRGSSGGTVTQILIDLLEMHVVEGVVTVKEKENEPYRFEPFLATTREQILEAAQSKYVILPTNQVIRDIEQGGKKVAYVGLPCQIQGMRKVMKSNSRLTGMVTVLISLFCGFNMEEEATSYLISKSGIEKSEIENLSYRHKEGEQTGFYIRGNDGHEFFVNKHGYTFMNLMFSPKRCWKCYDYSGEFADISVGDAWEKGQGFSRVIVRTQTGNEILEMLKNRKSICIEPCDESVILKIQKKVVTYKKRQISIRKKRMKNFPDYGIEFTQCRGMMWIKGLVLYWLLCFFKNPVGKYIKWILPFHFLVCISEKLKGKEINQNES